MNTQYKKGVLLLSFGVVPTVFVLLIIRVSSGGIRSSTGNLPLRERGGRPSPDGRAYRASK